MNYDPNYFTSLLQNYDLPVLFDFARRIGGQPNGTETKEIVIAFLVSRQFVPGVIPYKTDFAAVRQAAAAVRVALPINKDAPFQKASVLPPRSALGGISAPAVPSLQELGRTQPTIRVTPLPIPAPESRPNIPPIRVPVANPIPAPIVLPTTPTLVSAGLPQQTPPVLSAAPNLPIIDPRDKREYNIPKHIHLAPRICVSGQGCLNKTELKKIAEDLGLVVSGGKAAYRDAILDAFEVYANKKFERR